MRIVDKKILSVFLVSVCSLSLIGCENEAATEPTAESVVAEDENPEDENITEDAVAEETTQDNAEKPTRNTSVVEIPANLSDNLYDFQIAIDGTVYQFPMWAKDFEALGWTYVGDPEGTIASNEYAVSEEWEKDGVTVFTTMANLSINTINKMAKLLLLRSVQTVNRNKENGKSIDFPFLFSI